MATLNDLPKDLKNLFDSIELGDAEGLENMLGEFKGNVNAKLTTLGHTALHLAIQGGHFSCIKLLLNYGADVTAVDDNGNTPLHDAAVSGDSKIVEYLIAAKASLTAMNSAGKTASMMAPPETSLANKLIEQTRTAHYDLVVRELKTRQGQPPPRH